MYIFKIIVVECLLERLKFKVMFWEELDNLGGNIILKFILVMWIWYYFIVVLI